MDLDQGNRVGRLAPSPTGAQHVGNARTYLIAWLAARAAAGKVLLRIEDIDSPRVKPGADFQAIDDLRWLGLDWDGEPTWQTHRLSLYQSALAELKRQELVYPCTCTRSDIERAASAPHAADEGPVYPGTCAGRHSGDAESISGPFAWRFRLPDSPVSFKDGYCGKIEIDLHRLGGDFVVWKSADSPAYQLAVVVDDAAGGVTEVIRGNDLIPSTPRQLLLYRALGLRPPRFAHVPLVVGPDGRRLAKRHGDTRLATLRDRGVKPEALLGLLAWSCGWLDRVEPIKLAELLPLFQLDRIPPCPFVLTPDLLDSIGLRG
jgi:glutamyl-tRNA synthetase